MTQPNAKRLKLALALDQKVKNGLVDEQNDDFKRKARPSSQFLPSPPSILSLNNDCCLSILELLPLNDLCSVSQTCKQFQALSIDIYRRRHKSKVLIIENISHDGNMTFGPDERYTKCFAEYIQNVSLSQNVASKTGLAGLGAFYRAKVKTDYDSDSDEAAEKSQMDEQSSDEKTKIDDGPITTPITSLRFENWRSGLRKSHGLLLADIVQDVEVVTFSNTKVFGDLNKNMLQFLPNMNSLTLWETFDEPLDDTKIDWMEQIYPKLKYFAWHLEREVPVEKIKRFLQENPSIRTFSLQSSKRKTINALVGEGIRVDELFFDVTCWDALADLRDLCEQQIGVCRLHLKFRDSIRASLSVGQNLQNLIALTPYIEGLYFEDTFVDEELANVSAKCERLKMIQLNLQTVKKMKWLATIPNLEEVFVYRGVSIPTFAKYHKVLMMLVGQVQKLKKIYIRNNSRKFNEFGLDELNDERCKMTDSAKLKIYFKSDETTNSGRLDAVVCEFDKIEAMLVESETFDNPLVTEYLTTKGLSRMFYKRYLRSHR